MCYFLDNTPQAIVGTEVFVIRLRDEFKLWSGYLSCWLNSTYGQALLRRWIAGSVSPTLRQEDLLKALVPIPDDETLAKGLAEECQRWVEDLQQRLLEGSDFVRPSEQVMRMLGGEPPLPYLPLNWAGGGKRDPHGYCHDRPEQPVTDDILSPHLPVWLSHSIPQDRLDNNFFHPAAEIAVRWIETLAHEQHLPVRTIGQLSNNQVFHGQTPTQDGSIPTITGIQMNPNVIYPNLEKFGPDDARRLRRWDVLIVTHGTTEHVAVVTPSFLELYPKVTFSAELHCIRLSNHELAPYVCLFLNSRVGQALVRRFIAGGVIPTLRQEDLLAIPIPLPSESVMDESHRLLEALQDSFLQAARFTEPSNRLLERLGLTEPLPYLPVNWMPGGKRDPHGYYRSQVVE